MTAGDAPIVNSWFRHDEATVDELWVPHGYRVDDERSQAHQAKSLKRKDRRGEMVELISTHAWVVRDPHTDAPIGWIAGKVWPCHDHYSDITEGQMPGDADDLPSGTFELNVAPSHRGQGYGPAMLTAVGNHRMLRNTQLWLGIAVKNVPSQTAAKRAGFKHEFTTAHYRIEGGDDLRIDLQKHMMHFRRIAAA
ncbi:GNAT family N-acetyltransferase [Nocardia anaemiae]|uniref:GNAT family N-acetyltransferase n=1 Tax=Nocardia anaemiae TaxID=263910 RepID=UPI001471406B|nr:GNAT family N-acetyltransferase [Nocardia anaemiae]